MAVEPSTIDDLLKQESPDAQQVIVTLCEYARSGAKIDSRSVIQLLTKSNLTPEQYVVVKRYMVQGVATQVFQGQAPARAEYQQVADFIDTVHRISN